MSADKQPVSADIQSLQGCPRLSDPYPWLCVGNACLPGAILPGIWEPLVTVGQLLICRIRPHFNFPFVWISFPGHVVNRRVDLTWMGHGEDFPLGLAV